MRSQKTRQLFSFDKTWSMPVGLKRLEGWLEQHGVDTHAFKSERQCLSETANMLGMQIEWPTADQSCLPALLKLQEIVAPLHSAKSVKNSGRQPWRPQREPFLKSKGAASPVRGVSQNVLEEIIQRYNLEAGL